jgi:HEAT repeat protein
LTSGPVLSGLHSSDPEERRRAVSLLKTAQEGERVQLLMAALGDRDWRVRKEAIGVAAALAPAPDVLVGLLHALRPGENVGLRNATVEALGSFGADAVPALAETLPTLDADGRKLAVEALALSGQPAALAVLRELLGDTDPNVRAAAIEAVSVVGSTSGNEALRILDSCLDAPDSFLKLAALDGLNRLGMILPWRRIAQLLEDPVLERSLLRALGRAAHPHAAPLLIGALERARGAGVSLALSALVEFMRSGDQALQALSAVPAGQRAGAARRLLTLASPSEDDLELRRLALSAGGALGVEGVAALAAAALSDSRLLGEADEALTLLGPAAVPALLKRAAEVEGEARAACIDLVGRIAGEELSELVIPELVKALAVPTPEVARAALGALTHLGDAACLSAVAGCLGMDALRSAAEGALGAIAERHPEQARALARSAEPTGSHAHAAAVVIGVLGGSGQPIAKDIEFLSSLVSSSGPAERRAALEALGEIGGAEAVGAVAFALSDEEHDVRLAAVSALGRLKTSDGAVAGVPALLDVVERGMDSDLVAAAARALGESRDARAFETLRPLVQTGAPMAAVSAIEALARFGPASRRYDALLDGLSHSEPEVVKAALLALADESDPRTVVHLGVCLDHAAWDVRRLAADLLGRSPTETALGLLRARLSIENNPLVCEALERALDASGTRRTPAPGRSGSMPPRS